MKKRFLYLAVPALFASLTLSACNEDPTGQNNNNNNQTTEKYSFTFELDAPEAIKDDIKYTLSNGNGEYSKGTKIAVNISSYDSVNYSFDGYFVNNSKVSTETSYTIDLQADTTLVAKFSEKGGSENPENPDNPEEPDNPDNPSFADVKVGEVYEKGKLGLWQQTRKEALYFSGVMDGYYLGSTTTFSDAVEITSTKVSETELTLEITSGTNANKFIGGKIVGSGEDSHNNIVMQDDEFRWTYNAEYDAYTAKLSDTVEVYIGNYKSFTTFSLSTMDHIDEAGTNIAHVVQSEINDGGSTTDPEEPDNPDNPSFADVKVGEVYEKGKLGLWQQTRKEALYFSGVMDGYYLGSTTTFSDAVEITSTKVSETELTLEITSGTNANKFIGGKIVGSGEDSHNNIVMQDDEFRWTYNAEYDAYTAKLSDTVEVYIGNYKSFTTFSLSTMDHIDEAGTNIAHVVQSEIKDGSGSTTDPDTPDVPSGEDVYSGQIPAGKYEPIDANEYYKNINFDDEISSLKSDLKTLINTNFKNVHYDNARYMLQYTDEDLSDKGYIYGVYDGKLIKPQWDSGKTWNREHLWPASRLPNGRADDKEGSDLFNLRASNSSINGSRSNKYYSENGDGGYYPIVGNKAGNDQRGDVARSIFYMAFKYEELGLEVVENPQASVGYDDHYYKMGKLSTLIEWNEADPVDEFEMRRNSRIYEYQGNRNPFVDYPYLVDLFFQN